MDACTRCVNYEFKADNAGLDHERPENFVTSQWPGHPKFYPFYRVIIALVLTGWCIADVAYETGQFYHGQTWKWFIYATNWSFILLVLSGLFQATTACIYSFRSHWIIDYQYPRTTPLILKLQWLLVNISCNSAVVVTMSYWFFIALFDHSAILTTSMSKVKHTMNTVYVIIDLLLSGVPIRVLHMFLTVMLGSIYALFNALYFLNDGTITTGENGLAVRHYAYNFMDWNKPVEAVITCVLCVFQSLISQVIIFIIYKIRIVIYERMYFGGTGTELEAELQNIVTESNSYSTMDDKDFTDMTSPTHVGVK
ncbi:hypothetical protein LOTGIDRAFT_205169 [Lottia gigantea]|uniref:Protein rolling stone n=1 Tax=Lottia gigantea TaxID=225164 RepID=V4AAX0_LOTGI|nr:hypothetical protein LOTGIDRAFT_205169 [Lottia gigantea]ESP01149.1 hypothetical protein LOTGIDRAFT_205169 [Lottia gigantea]